MLRKLKPLVVNCRHTPTDKFVIQPMIAPHNAGKLGILVISGTDRAEVILSPGDIRRIAAYAERAAKPLKGKRK